MARNFVERAMKRLKEEGIDVNNEKNVKVTQTEKLKEMGKDQKKAPRAAPEIYDDTDVCRLLHMRRRILVAARTRNTRGTDWWCRGTHVGMTDAWIRKKGGDPSGMKPIEEGDGIVTLKATSRVANVNVMVCECVATGLRVVAKVKDSRLIHIGDQFDCRRAGYELWMDPTLNTEIY